MLKEFRRLQQLTSAGRPKGGAKEEAILLLKALRAKGFTNKELAFIFKCWSEPSIKRFTKGVEVKEMETKNVLMNTLSDFIESGNGISDIEEYLKAKAQLEYSKVTFQQVSELLRNLEAAIMPLQEVLQTIYFIRNSGSTPEQIQQNILDINVFKKAGIGPEIITELSKILKKHGNLRDTLEAMFLYEEIQEIRDERKEAETNLTLTYAKIKESENKLHDLGYYADYSIQLIKNRMDHHSLYVLMELLKKHGNAAEVLDTVNQYTKKKEIEDEISALQSKVHHFREEAERLTNDYNAKQKITQELNKSMGQIEARYEDSLRLTQIKRLITNDPLPEITPTDLKQILLSILFGSLYQINDRPDDYRNWAAIKSGAESLLKTLSELTHIG